MALRDQPNSSPHDLWFFGMIEHGPRGFDSLVEPEQDHGQEGWENYGIDWEEIENQQLMDHHFANNQGDANTAEQTAGVVVDAPEITQGEELSNLVDMALATWCVFRSAIWI
ncbi:hypothetical protein FRC07_000422 [Ceratobasidium sp. 392]|nr:hypothetical protein FRC07_000422 [Ceratobasidium sp. 392]